jgi:two-component system OmpR family sensor kinase
VLSSASVEGRDAATVVPSAWPALLALAVVVLLSIGMLGTDLLVEYRTADETTKLVDNALRSVALADDLRSQAHLLAANPVGREVPRAVLAQIARDTTRYEPLATYEGERAEWTRLRGLLDRLRDTQTTDARAVDPALVRAIETSLDQVVRINEREAARSVAVIRAAHRQAFMIDAAAGAVTFLLAVVVATALVRALRRQRALVAAHLALARERQDELEAFAGRVAHDLRGPLAPIRGYADLLRTDSGPPPREIGERITKATGRMIAIIDSLLALSVSGRPGSGRTAVEPVVAQAIEDARSLLADADIELAVANCAVRCPPEVLGRIVQNLVSNAIKYRAPERRLALGIAATRRGDTVELAVSDNGVGMDAVAAARAFDAFYRADAARGIAGHGLGLSIVKRTVDALGGSCSLASEPGAGTRVAIRLPAAV